MNLTNVSICFRPLNFRMTMVLVIFFLGCDSKKIQGTIGRGATQIPSEENLFVAEKLAFSVQPINLTSGASQSMEIRVQVLDASDSLVLTSSAEITLSLSTDPSLGVAKLIGTSTVQAVFGEAIFENVNLDDLQTGYQLGASSSGLTSALSSSFNIEGPRVIYRSVGYNNSTALDSGGTGKGLTITNSVAKFQTALPVDVGVGDVIQYDSDGNGSIDSLAVIHERISGDTYSLRTPEGAGIVANLEADEDWSIFRAYTSLIKAEAGADSGGPGNGVGGNDSLDDTVEEFETFNNIASGKDISASEEAWHFALYSTNANDSVHLASATAEINGWTTSESNYIKVYTPFELNEVGVSQRHSGSWDSGKFVIQDTIDVNDEFVYVEGLQMEFAQYDNATALHITDSLSGASKTWVSNNIVRSTAQGAFTYVRGIRNRSFGTVYMWNNIVYGMNGHDTQYGIDLDVNGGTSYLYNNTINDCRFALGKLFNHVTTLKNNLVQGATVVGYDNGNIQAASTNNLSNLGDAPGTNPVNSSAVMFVNAAGGDLHLSSGDGAAKDQGVDPSDSNITILDDIDGQTRSGIWDIGADSL